MTCCVESLEFNLSLKPVLGLHHHINHLEPVIAPFLDTPEVSGPTLVVDDKGHGAVAQTFLEHNQSANAAITVFKRKDLLEAHMEV